MKVCLSAALLLTLVSGTADAQVNAGGKAPEASVPFTVTQGTVLDIRSEVASGGETGLLGMAFHPDFPTDPRVFVSRSSSRSFACCELRTRV